jgi:hypothetical protein
VERVSGGVLGQNPQQFAPKSSFSSIMTRFNHNITTAMMDRTPAKQRLLPLFNPRLQMLELYNKFDKTPFALPPKAPSIWNRYLTAWLGKE